MKLRRRCKCGCGEITSAGKKWILGHNPGYYKHGLRNHKLYIVWRNMKLRCYNKNHKSYPDYGDRGIRVSIKWKNNISAFYKWAMSHGWEEGLQIDRRDNDGNYNPNNCRFVTNQINMNNRRKPKSPKKYKNNTSGFKGVSFIKRDNKYRSQLTINSKKVWIGQFNTAEEAAEAIEEYKERYNG